MQIKLQSIIQFVINYDWKGFFANLLIYIFLLAVINYFKVYFEIRLYILLVFLAFLGVSVKKNYPITLIMFGIIINMMNFFTHTFFSASFSLFFIPIVSILEIIVLIIIYRTTHSKIKDLSDESQVKQKNILGLLNNYSSLQDFSKVGIIERDIKELQLELQKLKNAHPNLSEYLSKNVDEVKRLNKFGKVVSVNEQAAKIFRTTSPEDLIKHFENTRKLQLRSINNLINTYVNIVEGREFGIREANIYTVDGNVLTAIIQTRYPSEANPFFTTLIIDITEMDNAKRRIKESEKKFSTILEQAPVGVLITRDGIIESANKSYKQMLGYENDNIEGMSILNFIDKSMHPLIIKRINQRKEGGIMDNSMRKSFGITKSGKKLPIEINISDIVIDGDLYTISFVKDITKEIEQEKMIHQLHNSHKLESLGILAGGIAHDFNNHLAALIGGLNLLELDENLNQEQKELIQDLLDTAKRGSSLTQQLLAYTGKAKQDINPIKISTIFDNLISLCKLIIPNNITIIYVQSGIEQQKMLVNQDQISQVLMNLIINGKDAIGEKNGEITVSAIIGYIPNDPNISRFMNPGIELSYEKEYVIFKVKDTGSGIPKDLQAQIFDPFFSTKKSQGRGLGLSVVQGIVFSHEGVIDVNSEIGVGTEISIYLPLRIVDEKVIKQETTNDILEKSYEGKILIIEDESTVRKVLTKMVDKMGFSTIEAENGLVGIEKYSENKDDIRLVILDLTMPVLTGKDTFNRLIEMNPNIHIIIASGYSLQDTSDFTHHKFVTFLQKPFVFELLKEKIGKILD